MKNITEYPKNTVHTNDPQKEFGKGLNLPSIVFSLCLACLGFLGACRATEEMTAGKAVEAPAIEIQKGSPTEDLVAVLAEPLHIEALEDDPQNVTVWIYEESQTEVNLLGARTQEVPYVDPFTGEQKMIKEPIFEPETTTRTQVIKVYIVDEKVLGWKIETLEDRELSR